ncbi:MAG: NAD(P)/FAD-dependent oxidoreductase [Verrucomicrobiota bacterium]
MTKTTFPSKKKRIVIVGGGFGGVAAAKKLAKASVEVALIDRRNYHLFQPLLYQVATAALNPSEIASPIRKIFRNSKNVHVGLGEVECVDLAQKEIFIQGESLSFDYLILAAGATHSYFGNDGWAKDAPGLKSIEDATEIRRRILLAFEAAELEEEAEARRARLTFVIIGGGPTGCELAGAIAEVARHSLPEDFRRIDTKTSRIILMDGGDRLLRGFPEECSTSALRQLESLGVEVQLQKRVTKISDDGVNCGEEFFATNNTFWAAGVKASPLGESLGVPLDRAGRVLVENDLSIPGHPHVFVIGDQAAITDPETDKAVPGVAQGAIQSGAFVGSLIRKELESLNRNQSPPARDAFFYFDKGNLATLGRYKAVADALGMKFGGFPAWFIWAAVHILFLVNFRNKVAVAWTWAWTYLRSDRNARLIIGDNTIKLKQAPKLD